MRHNSKVNEAHENETNPEVEKLKVKNMLEI